MYKIERKLGKGGFGQVFLGRPISSSGEWTSGPGFVEVSYPSNSSLKNGFLRYYLLKTRSC